MFDRGVSRAYSSIVVVVIIQEPEAEITVEKEEFRKFRLKLNRTQETMSQLLGVSVKAVRSYEQGWRHIPHHVERQVLLLVALQEGFPRLKTPCWIIMSCPDERKADCPAWEFNAGTLCWLINGTQCAGAVQATWGEKIEICRSCNAFPSGLRDGAAIVSNHD